MINDILLKDIIKYLIIIGIIYTILKLLPSQKITNKDIGLLVFIIMIIFVTIDYKCFKNNFETFNNTTNLQNKIINPLKSTTYKPNNI